MATERPVSMVARRSCTGSRSEARLDLAYGSCHGRIGELQQRRPDPAAEAARRHPAERADRPSTRLGASVPATLRGRHVWAMATWFGALSRGCQMLILSNADVREVL